jgi:[ribosomal protein S5]-alanine N-acetyltransferase
MELTTERLLLRDFTEDDRAAFLAYQSDPRFLEFHGPGDWGPEQASGLLDLFLRWQAERPRLNYQLAIVERATSTVIGCGGVRSSGFERGVAELGLELASANWGRGLATEAARALLDLAFRGLGLRAIVATSVTQNRRVARLVEKLGFQPTGTPSGPDWLRSRGWSQTEWRLTAEQWEPWPPSPPRSV